MHSAPRPDFRAQLAPLASQICDKAKVTIFLDYLCGKTPVMTSLKVGHNMKVQCYDPKVERFKESPLAAQMVFCALPEDDLSETAAEDMIAELEMLTGAVCLLAVGESERLPEWWIYKVVPKFEIQTFQRVDGGFYMILYPNALQVLAS
jgi:hypothetical protein